MDTEVLSKDIMRVIVSIDDGCSISTWKTDPGPACWYFHDDMLQKENRVKAVIGPSFNSSAVVSEVAYATWVGLPVFIDGGVTIIYQCPANRFITVGTLNNK